MTDRRVGVRYSWSNLQPIRALVVTMFGMQFVGSLLAVLFTEHGTEFGAAFERFWFGGAAASFPGFCVGAFIQWWKSPGSVSDNFAVVRVLGLIAALLSVDAIAESTFAWW